MKREPLYPIDLGHIQDKAQAIVHALSVYNNHERSQEVRDFYLKKAEQLASTIVHDIDYLMDTRLFDGRRALGLDDEVNQNES